MAGKAIQTKALAGDLPKQRTSKASEKTALRKAIEDFDSSIIPSDEIFAKVLQLYSETCDEVELACLGRLLGTDLSGVRKWRNGISCPQPSGKKIVVDWISNQVG